MAAKKSTRSARSSGRRSRTPEALQLLKDDHERVTAMFSEFEKADEDEKEEIAERICGALTLHAQLEETIFYPAVREAIEDEEIMNEADVEHAGAKELISKIEACTPSDQHFEALVTVLGENIKHHVREEEGEMFKQIRRTDLDLDELARRMKEFKRENRDIA
jgi:hypothetical protein